MHSLPSEAHDLNARVIWCLSVLIGNVSAVAQSAFVVIEAGAGKSWWR